MNAYMKQACVNLDLEKGEGKDKHVYTFSIPFGSPYEEVYLALSDYKEHVEKMESDAKEREAKEKLEKEKEDEKKDDVEVEVE